MPLQSDGEERPNCEYTQEKNRNDKTEHEHETSTELSNTHMQS